MFFKRKRDETADHKFRLLFDNMLNGFAYCKVIYDEQGQAVDWVYLLVNKAFVTLTGLEDITGKRVSEAIPTLRETNPELLDIYGRVSRGGHPERFETFVKALNDWFSISVYCPEPDHFVAVFDVITERRHSQEIIKRVLTTINHEFRTPLTYVWGYSLILRDNGSLSVSEYQDLLGRMLIGVDRLEQLINGFLFLMSLHSGDAKNTYLSYRRPLYEWDKLTTRVVRRKSLRAQSKNISITTDISNRVRPVIGYDDYILIALNQLLDNAVKFTPPGGTITISVQPDSDGIRVSITDTGIGIDEKDIPELFAPFGQVEREHQEQQGAGLGLAIVKGIVDIHGGRVGVESEMGLGSTFSIWFPYVTASDDRT